MNYLLSFLLFFQIFFSINTNLFAQNEVPKDFSYYMYHCLSENKDLTKIQKSEIKKIMKLNKKKNKKLEMLGRLTILLTRDSTLIQNAQQEIQILLLSFIEKPSLKIREGNNIDYIDSGAKLINLFSSENADYSYERALAFEIGYLLIKAKSSHNAGNFRGTDIAENLINNIKREKDAISQVFTSAFLTLLKGDINKCAKIQLWNFAKKNLTGEIYTNLTFNTELDFEETIKESSPEYSRGIEVFYDFHDILYRSYIEEEDPEVKDFAFNEFFKPFIKVGYVAMQYAINQNHANFVKFLINNGMDLKTNADLEYFPLIAASQASDSTMLKAILKSDSDIDLKYLDLVSPLMNASAAGQLSNVKILIEAGADINLCNKNGQSALMFAAEKGHYKIVKYLIEKGADVHIKDKEDKTALQKAIENKHEKIAKLISNDDNFTLQIHNTSEYKEKFDRQQNVENNEGLVKKDTIAADNNVKLNNQTRSENLIIVAENRIKYAPLGITCENLSLKKAKELGYESINGILVIEVEKSSLASQEGLKKGDLITNINRKQISNVNDLNLVLEKINANETLLMRINRRKKSLYIAFKIENSLNKKITNNSDYSREYYKADLDLIEVFASQKFSSSQLDNNSNIKRIINFRNLPKKCIIKIYGKSGKLVKEIDYEGQPFGNYEWNVNTDDLQELQHGWYLYHIDAPGIGKTMGRVAILK